MDMLIIKSTTSNTIYTMQELYMPFYKHSMELHLMFHYKAFHFHQYFNCILQLIYQLFLFYTYNSYNLNILQYHMIYRIHTHNY